MLLSVLDLVTVCRPCQSPVQATGCADAPDRLGTHVCPSRNYFIIPKRDDKLESGALLLDGGEALLVSLQRVSTALFRCFVKYTNFSRRIGPLRASTRPYFLLRTDMSKNSS